MKGRNQHVTKRSDGNWQVKGEGASRASFVTTTQSEAIKLGRRICSNQESELIIHRCDGRIRARDPMAMIPTHRGDMDSAPCRQRPVIAYALSLNDFFIVTNEIRAWGYFI